MHRQFDIPGRSAVFAAECAVATSHPLATSTALNILREGGNAVDAAIAASATLCVVEPHMTGVGGDCFAIVCEPDGALYALNGSGRSGSAASLQWHLDQGHKTIPECSAHSVTVPGAVNAWETLHQKFGQADFTRLFADAISYGENGFPVSQRVGSDWAGLAEKLLGDPGAMRHLLHEGAAPAIGSVWKFPALAAVLRTIALEGSKAFYEGDIAREISKTVGALGGLLNEEDLAGVGADWVQLITTNYNGHTLHEIPPNGQGLTALILANLVSQIGTADNPDAPQRAHMEMECGRIAYSVRDAHIADMDHMNVAVEALLSQNHTKSLAKLYHPQKRNNHIELPDLCGSDTIYLSVVDRDQRAVSFINSVYAGFGSGIVTPNTGIALQNRGDCFNLIPGHANAIGPSKRPLQTIIPAMVTKDGKPVYSYGVMGGSYQAMGHVHVLSNLLDYGMDPQQALDHARIFWDDEDRVLELESAISPETEEFLKARGHKCRRGGLHGGGQIIHIDHTSGILCAGSDSRKDGHAAGF